MALSLDIILAGEILKHWYTACIPSCLDNEDVFMIACIDTSSLCRSSLRVMHRRGPSISFYGCGFLFVRYRRQFCIEKSRWEFEFCPLSGIKKRPLLGSCFSITTMLISIRNTELVRCREVVRFSEGPLSEARLYFAIIVIND